MMDRVRGNVMLVRLLPESEREPPMDEREPKVTLVIELLYK